MQPRTLALVARILATMTVVVEGHTPSGRDGGIRTRGLLLPKQRKPVAWRGFGSPEMALTCHNCCHMSPSAASSLLPLAPTLAPATGRMSDAFYNSNPPPSGSADVIWTVSCKSPACTWCPTRRHHGDRRLPFHAPPTPWPAGATRLDVDIGE